MDTDTDFNIATSSSFSYSFLPHSFLHLSIHLIPSHSPEERATHLDAKAVIGGTQQRRTVWPFIAVVLQHSALLTFLPALNSYTLSINVICTDAGDALLSLHKENEEKKKKRYYMAFLCSFFFIYFCLLFCLCGLACVI